MTEREFAEVERSHRTLVADDFESVFVLEDPPPPSLGWDPLVLTIVEDSFEVAERMDANLRDQILLVNCPSKSPSDNLHPAILLPSLFLLHPSLPFLLL